MIAKILPSNNLKNILDYHFEKINESFGKILNPLMQDISKKEAIKFINEPSCLRSHINKNKLKKEPIFHVSLSLNKEEKLSDEVFLNLAQDYVKAMGFKNHNILFIRHDDTEHSHVHVLLNRIDLSSLKITEKGFEKLNSMKISRRLEKKYNLKITSNEFKNKKEIKIDKNRQGIIKSLQDKIKECQINSYSLNSFKQELLNRGIVLFESKDKKGRKRIGFRYSYFGNKKYFNSSELGNDFTFSKIEKQFKYRDNREKCKIILNGLIEKYKEFESLNDFKILAKKEGISIIESRYDDGGIFGISFSIGQEKFKGSELGISWSSLKNRIKLFDKSVKEYDQNNDLNLYNLLSGKRINELPYITKTEFINLNKTNQIKYIEAFLYSNKFKLFKDFMNNASVFSNTNLINEEGILNDVSFDKTKISDTKFNLNQVQERIENNLKRALWAVCAGETKISNVKSKLDETFGIDYKINNDIITIEGKNYDLKQYGLFLAPDTEGKYKIPEHIMDVQKDHWYFDDLAEREKRKRKKGKGL